MNEETVKAILAFGPAGVVGTAIAVTLWRALQNLQVKYEVLLEPYYSVVLNNTATIDRFAEELEKKGE